jgi:hypothetical protein
MTFSTVRSKVEFCARPNTLLGMNYDLKKQLSFLTTLTLVKLLGNMPTDTQGSASTIPM